VKGAAVWFGCESTRVKKIIYECICMGSIQSENVQSQSMRLSVDDSSNEIIDIAHEVGTLNREGSRFCTSTIHFTPSFIRIRAVFG
jgi:hypothetical protein